MRASSAVCVQQEQTSKNAEFRGRTNLTSGLSRLIAPFCPNLLAPVMSM